MNPGEPELDVPFRVDRFHIRLAGYREISAFPLCPSAVLELKDPARPIAPRVRRLFPFTWTEYLGNDLPIELASLSFSPIIPGSPRETSLPVFLVVWRARNQVEEPIEVSLMLTWAAGWPALVQSAEFDMQHDNLCITGSMGDPCSPNRMGIAVPDLHSEGVYKQGMEPWRPPQGYDEICRDFAEDGELDPAVARGTPQGAAAWVKFDLEPGETKEIPFVIVWHFPMYENGPYEGKYRYYTQFLGKVRPDNAVVWLAEEVVQNYGTESANYRHWINQISDWQEAVLSDPRHSPEEHAVRINRLEALVQADTIWTDDGMFEILPRGGWTEERLLVKLADAPALSELWPEISDRI